VRYEHLTRGNTVRAASCGIFGEPPRPAQTQGVRSPTGTGV